jgi:hypothetical protein
MAHQRQQDPFSFQSSPLTISSEPCTATYSVNPSSSGFFN